MSYKKFILLFGTYCCLVIASESGSSNVAKVGFSGAQFLKIDVGARGFAMGSSVDPVINDASAVFWNPAGLTNSDKKNLFTSKTSWLAGINHMATSYSMPIKSYIPGYFAISFVGLTTDKMKETTIEFQNGTGEYFSVNDISIGLAYAIKLTDKFRFGIHAKLVNENLVQGLPNIEEGYGTGSTWAVDVGTLFHTGYKTITIGMSIRNFGPEMQLDGTYIDYDEGEEVVDSSNEEPIQNSFRPYGLPLTFRFGISANPFKTNTSNLLVSIVGEHPADNIERINVGAEYTLMKFFVGRAGYVFNHDTRSGSLGVGLKEFPIASLGRINVDFAISQFALFDPVWIASFGVLF